MAQTGYTPISIYYSATATNTPTAGNLVAGELAINTADGKLFYKDSAGVVQVIGTKGGVGTSSTTQVLYNSSGLVVGSANLTFNGTTLTLANDASISGLTVGKGGGSVSNNTALGYQAGYSNTSGVRNTFAGYGAGYSNTTGLANTFVGGPDATGGYSAGYSNTSGSYNVALGDGSLAANTTASYNTAVGYQAGYSNTTGGSNAGFNTFLGGGAGYACTGSSNTLVGANAGVALTSGQGNLIIGGNLAGAAGGAMTTGSKNTLIGSYSGNQGGLDIRTASNYIVLSDGDGNPRLIGDNSGAFFIKRTSTYSYANGGLCVEGVSGNPCIVAGTSGTTSYNNMVFGNGNGGVGTIATNGSVTTFNSISDYRLKNVIGVVTDSGQRIDALEPIEYDWKAGGRTRGFLAHKFAEIYPASVSGEKDAIDEDGKPIYQAMQASTPEVMADLIAEIQSLRKRVALLESK